MPHGFLPGALGYLDSLPVQFEYPLLFLVLPLGIVFVLVAFYYNPPEHANSRRRRIAFVSSRILIITLLVTAAAGPYTVAEQTVTREPSVRLLVDESASMDVFDASADEIANQIEAEGVPVSQTTIATDERSAIGDSVLSNLERDTSIILLSDGRVTHGRTIGDATDTAFQSNVTINAIQLDPERPEAHVRMHGPAKTSIGINNSFLVEITGVALEDSPKDVTVTIGNETVHTETIRGASDIEFTHAFTESGEYQITTTVTGEDQFAVNNEYRKTVRVVERPEVLYVSRVDYPFESFLEQHYNVTRATEIPGSSELDAYYAVVIQDVAAGDLGNIDALHQFAIEGNGVVVVGGPNSYDNGGYGESTIASMLPVRIGEYDRSASIVLTIDISGSAAEQLPVIKSIALDALDQIGDQHRVGIVAFDQQAHVVAEFQEVGPNRGELEDTILRLQSGGGTRIDRGLLASRDMLRSEGEVILISDGVSDRDRTMTAAREVSSEGVRVTTIGTGGVMDEELMRDVAGETGRSYIKADQTTRLSLLFGGADDSFSADQLTIIDDTHFITTGVELTADPSFANDVTQKDSARYLVATGSGDPAVTAWRYGLGRVIAVTTYAADGSLGELLQPPDSLLLSKGVNWAIGNPERKTHDVFETEDTRSGTETTVVYRGSDRPDVPGYQFVRIGTDRYEARFSPDTMGFDSIGGSTYAVNPPREYAAFGMSPAIEGAVRQTNGRVFAPEDTAEIAEFARSEAIRRQPVVTSWAWVVFLAALLSYLGEVTVRRLQEVYSSNP